MEHAVLCAALAFGLASASLQVRAASSCKLTLMADWPVVSTRGVAVVEGSVNGQKIGVLLDTGASTLIFRSAAERLGLTRRVERRYRVFGVGGETYGESTIVDEVRIGSLVRKNWQVMVAGERDFGKSAGLLLGEDVFDKVDVEFDLPHRRVRLFQPEGCQDAVLAYWAPDTASRINLEPDAKIVLPVMINGKPIHALLDSGAAVSVLDRSAAERLGLTDPGHVTSSGKNAGLGAKTVDSWTARVESFTIGNESVSDTIIRFADLWKDATYTTRFGGLLPERFESMPAMLLGSDFLRAHRVLVAHSQRKMYFTYEGGPVFQPKTEDAAGPAVPDEGAAKPPPPGAGEREGN